MKIIWRTIGIACAAAAGASIITGAVCKCTDRFRRTFNDDSKKNPKK